MPFSIDMGAGAQSYSSITSKVKTHKGLKPLDVHEYFYIHELKLFNKFIHFQRNNRTKFLKKTSYDI